jgi:putative NIF3 family GTP cyclohydrolase 1 type 2
MTALGLNQALCSLWPELNIEKTVDRVIWGDPQQDILKVAVCWMPYSSTLKKAAEMGCNVIVAHEPTFFDHFELRQAPVNDAFLKAKEKKSKLIDELGLTIIRCHDVWDAVPQIGVPFEWGRFLGLGEPIKSERYFNLYEIETFPAIDVAKQLAAKTAIAGQKTVEFYGDPSRKVSTIGIGTGCCSEALRLYEFGADLAVTVDDIARAWIIGEYCQDEGHPLVVVNHGVSEDCAMESLATQIREFLPEIEVVRIAQGASYLEVSA